MLRQSRMENYSKYQQIVMITQQFTDVISQIYNYSRPQRQ